MLLFRDSVRLRKIPSLAATTMVGCVALPLSALAAPEAMAVPPGAAAESSGAEVKNDSMNILGDSISFPVKRTGIYVDDPKESVCIPARTGMKGVAYTHDNKKMKVRLLDSKKEGCETTPPTGTSLVSLQSDRLVEVDVSDGAPFSRYGWSYGTLLVPYKYTQGGSKSFKGNTSLGAYLGRRFDANELWDGIQLNVVGFMGATTAEAKTVDDAGETKSENLIGVSYGGGLIFTIKDGFQSGVIIGKDRFGSAGDQKIEDAGKTWVAIAIGFDFGK